MKIVSVERWYVSAMQHAEHARDREVRDRVGAERLAGAVAPPHAPGRDGDDGEVDGRVAQPGARPGDGHRDDVVVADVVAELAQHDRDLDGLAVLVARVVVERVRERAEAEDAVARLDVVQRRAGPAARPLREHPVAGALERTVIREVAPGDVRVEPFGAASSRRARSSTCRSCWPSASTVNTRSSASSSPRARRSRSSVSAVCTPPTCRG